MIPLQLTYNSICAARAAAALSRALGFGDPSDPRLEPVRGDEIDERVNEQLARGRTDKL